MRTEWLFPKKPSKPTHWLLRIDLQSWFIGFLVWKNYMRLSTDFEFQILCFRFCYRKYWKREEDDINFV